MTQLRIRSSSKIPEARVGSWSAREGFGTATSDLFAWVCGDPMIRWYGLHIQEYKTCHLSWKTWLRRSRSKGFRFWCWSIQICIEELVCKSWVKVPKTWQLQHSPRPDEEKMTTWWRWWQFEFGNEVKLQKEATKSVSLFLTPTDYQWNPRIRRERK